MARLSELEVGRLVGAMLEDGGEGDGEGGGRSRGWLRGGWRTAAAATIVLAALTFLTFAGISAHEEASSGSPVAMRHLKNPAVSALALSIVTAPVVAQTAAVQWRVEDGGNGHWYSLQPNLTCWEAAEAFAVTNGGHLASVTSGEEAQFCSAFVQSTDYWICAWVGGSRLPGSDIATGWTWTGGEPFVPGAIEWMAGNPGCCAPNEYYLGLNNIGRIGDLQNCDGLGGSIIEWSADCNADGIVDYGQIVAGDLDDTNANGIPDCCEQGYLCGCPGDITGGGTVDSFDISVILGAWGTAGQGEFDADVDDNGTVDGADLGIVLSGWGACP